MLPRAAAHVLERAGGRPAQIPAGFGGIGIAGGDVARAARLDAVRHGSPRRLLEGADELQHAVAAPGAQVDRMPAGVAGQKAQGGGVALGQVHDVDVVPHAGAVGRGVVVAEHAQLGPLAGGDLGDVGHEVVGHASRAFTDQAAVVRAHRVEVAQAGQAPGRIGGRQIAQDFLDVQLAAAVGVDGARGVALVQGQGLRLAIDGGAAAEDQGAHAAGTHGLQQAERALDVVAEVVQRFFDGFAYGLQAGEVDDGVDGVVAQGAGQQGLVAHVAPHEDRRRAQDARQLADDGLAAVGQVVEQHDVVALLRQDGGGVAADVARTAGEQDVHAGCGSMSTRIRAP